MNEQSTILITGAAGFIGSCMVQHLNEAGYNKLILSDKFVPEKEQNYANKHYRFLVDRDELFEWLHKNKPAVDAVIHLGARTDTTEQNIEILRELNVEYSQDIWNYCTGYNIPLVYASSAATYGAGDNGYSDDHENINELQPLNPYGQSKHDFDLWALQQMNQPPFWAGLKFFNVYGPNEYHKGRMASVIFHAFNQIKNEGLVKLFKSHKEGYNDGEQLRDFIYVKDVVKVIAWMLQNNRSSALQNGIYNLGTGKARTFIDLVTATFATINMQPDIVFVDMPKDIQNNYQYFTEAKMDKLKAAGYEEEFFTLENGVEEYVKEYLIGAKNW